MSITVTSLGSRTTDADGEAYFFGMGSCPLPDLVAIATPPPGYRLTTPDRLPVPRRTSATPQFVRFGFAKDVP